MQRAFRTFIGVDLGGGKGKTTAVARLRLVEEADGTLNVVADDFGGDRPWYDDRLIAYLLRHAGEAVIAIDAPLTLTACTRCTLPSCPTTDRCDVPAVRWLRERADHGSLGGKPRYTPYTQRATEVVLHEDFGILPRETLGQGMGPLTARAAYLRRALADRFTLNRDLLEVYPKATLAQLFPDGVQPQDPPRPEPRAAEEPPPRRGPRGAGQDIGVGVVYKDGNGRTLSLEPRTPKSPARLVRSQIARHYKRSGHATPIREQILRRLPGLSFGPGQWQEFVLQNDHQLDALLCAYTAFLWARDGWQMPQDPIFEEDGWIWFPPSR